MKATILVCDDTHDLCELFSDILTEAGYNAIPAVTLASAKRFRESARPALIITDDLDRGGAVWAGELHRQGQKVLYTGASEAPPKGVRHLPKPISREALLGTVAEMLRQQ